MGQINNAFLKVAGSLATAAAASEMNKSQKVSLAKEDAEIAQAEFNIKDEQADAEKAVAEAENTLAKVSPNAKGQYRDEKGKYMTKASGEERKNAADLDLQKRQEALNVVLKKSKAIMLQRQDWERRAKRIGGLK